MPAPRVAPPTAGATPRAARPVATRARPAGAPTRHTLCVAAWRPTPPRGVRSVAAHAAPASFREDERGGVGGADVTRKTADAPTSSPLPPFSWAKQWYPVAAEADTPTDRPVPVKLLGERLVLWRDAPAGTWRCVSSACPHRLAPLETGRLEDGGATLVCSYHGWAFNGADGAAVRVPQADHDGAPCGARACASRRSKVDARPTATAAGLIWVWGDASPTAAADAAAAPPPVVSDVVGDRPPDATAFPLTSNQQFVRRFPVPFDVMVENLLDQSHVPFAHAGVAYNPDAPWRSHFSVTDVTVATDTARADTGARGAGDGLAFQLEWSPDSINPPIKQRVRFVPPCFVEYATPDAGSPSGFRATLWFYTTPVDADTVLVFNHAVVTEKPKGVPDWLLSMLAARPRWVDHLLLNNVFDGDLAYLPQAAANAREAERGGKNWARAYYLPASADNSVIAWRRWLGGRGGGGWEAEAGVPRAPRHDVPPSALFNRLDDHTVGCPSCNGAMQRARAIATGLRAGAVVAVAIAAGAAVCGGGDGANVAGWAAAAAGAAAAGAAADAFAGLFVFKQYEHWKAR